jgi:hypothetical protein
VCPNELIALLVSERLRLQAVRHASMRGWTRREPPCRQQNRGRRPHGALVREQHIVRPAAIAEMLVDVYDRLVWRLPGAGVTACCSAERESAANQEVPAFHWETF